MFVECRYMSLLVSRNAAPRKGKHGRWLFLWLVIGFCWAAPARAGVVDNIVRDVTDPRVSEERCRKGDAALCTSAGNIYRSGFKVKKDMDKAIEYYKMGCSGGAWDSCHSLYELGFDDRYGKRTKVNISRAADLFAAACEGKPSGKYSGNSCQELAKLYIEGKGVGKDITRGIALLQRGCDGNGPRACRDLGNILLDGKLVSRDVPAAVAAYRKACSGKNKEARACEKLGLLYNKGDQVERDVKAAEKYLTDGCTFPNWIGTACNELAVLYDTDLRGRKTEEEVYKLYRIACDQVKQDRVGNACVATAQRHLSGKGAKKDPDAVIHYYNRGCMLKDPKACRLSCEWNCERGQPKACAAIKSGKVPLGVSNCL